MDTRLALSKDAAPWGILTSLDLYGCDPKIIRDPEEIKKYVIKLCEMLGVRRFGDCQVVHFGKDERVEGYSMVQLIETSLISGHFANMTNAVYIDIFSCKSYDSEQAALFSRDFFGAESLEIHVINRI